MSRTLHLFGTDWCAMMVPIHALQWYRFADTVNFHGLRYYYQRCDALSFGSLKRRLKIKNRIVPYLFSINVLLLMQRYYLIVQSICIVEKVFVWAPKKQEVFLFLLDFKVLNWYDKEVC